MTPPSVPPPAETYWRTPRLWPGETVVCIAGGPSLAARDVDACRGKARVIAINDAYRLAPWADLLYACDAKWWRWHGGVPDFAGLKTTLEPPEFPGIRHLEETGHEGFDARPGRLRTGRNGGYQAIHLAVHLGAARIVLLGYDMRIVEGRSHWFGGHPVSTPPEIYAKAMLPCFATLAPALAERGVEVVNCTPGSALDVWPIRPLAEVL